jgi:primary-amine oxidase
MASTGVFLQIWVRTFTVAVAALAILVAVPVANAQSANHPLDGLTASEIWTAYEVLQASQKIDANTRFPMVQLREPPKAEVLAWNPGQEMRREAFLVVRQGNQMFEAVVDVNGKKLASWTEMKGVQPNMPDEEGLEIGEVVKKDLEVQKALKVRNISDPWNVVCGSTFPEDYLSTAQGRGLLQVVCFARYGPLEDWSPIGGLLILWDDSSKKVVRVIDTGAVPPLKADRNYYAAASGATREAPSPLNVQQPQGPSFRLVGQSVNWQNWNFHFRIDRRVGLVVSNVAYHDGDKLRSILFEGSLSELFMAYMSASEEWVWATFFDIGEAGDGFSSTLVVGEDCPDNAVYFDQAYADWHGIPQVKPRAACLYEEPSGSMAWRHDGSSVESRKMRNLVLRTIGTFDNYDYVCDWVFQQDGAIRVRVGATGQDNISVVKSRTAAEDATGQDDRYGRFIAENTIAINHDHFFCFRLDFDIDGMANSFVRDKIQMNRLPADSQRKSLWVAEPEIAKTEEQAKAQMSMQKPEIWRIINPNVKSSVGYPVGYELVPGSNAMSLLVPEDYPQKRAGFTDYHIWVTPFRENERYAAGDYPFRSKGGDGLPAWTKANRPIDNTDIVLWYTMGFHHVPHTEDWPVMTTTWHEFVLKPVNFFDHNPALDLPK